MDLRLVLSLTINGIAMGLVYGLMTMGLILLMRAVGMLNFAQGDILCVGGFIGAAVLNDFNLPLPLAVIVSLILFLLIGLIFMACIYWPVRNSSYPAAIVISTMGASIIIREVLLMIWGSLPLTMPAIIRDEASVNGRSKILEIFGTPVSYQYIAVLVIGIIAVFLTFTLFEKLYAGRIMSAASQDRFAAELIGIPVFATTAATYMISFSLAATAGFLAGPIFNVSVSLSTLQLYAFAGLVIGGVGNIKGAVVGSILVGLVESYTMLFNLSQYKQAIIFSLLLVFLIFKPNGLFKSQVYASNKA